MPTLVLRTFYLLKKKKFISEKKHLIFSKKKSKKCIGMRADLVTITDLAVDLVRVALVNDLLHSSGDEDVTVLVEEVLAFVHLGTVILFRLYCHKLKIFNYITKLIMFSHNCVNIQDCYSRLCFFSFFSGPSNI